MNNEVYLCEFLKGLLTLRIFEILMENRASFKKALIVTSCTMKNDIFPRLLYILSTCIKGSSFQFRRVGIESEMLRSRPVTIKSIYLDNQDFMNGRSDNTRCSICFQSIWHHRKESDTSINMKVTSCHWTRISDQYF